MATRNIVPRANEEGNIGTSLKNWLKGWFKDIFVSNTLTDGTNTVTIVNLKDAVTKKHSANADTALGAQSENLDMNIHKIVGLVDPITNQEGATKKYVDDNMGISDIVEDTTPQLGGELDCQSYSIGFTQQIITGNGITAIDWKLGNKFKFTFGAQNETITFTNPSKPCNLLLIVVQDGTGSRTITWSGMTIKWFGGVAPTLSITPNAVDIISFYFDGSIYYGQASLDFKTV